MLLFYLPFLISSEIIVYGSAVQIKNVGTKNRLGATSLIGSKTFNPPIIYSSRPPYDEQWLWNIEPDGDSTFIEDNLTRTPIKCGSIITLSNTIHDVYLSTRKNKKGQIFVNSTISDQGSESQWLLKCPYGSDKWEQMMHFQLQNLRYKCYLTTYFNHKFAQNRYSVTCQNISKYSVWKVTEGIFLSDNNEGAPSNEIPQSTNSFEQNEL